jgi:hypothetical protein
LAKVNRKDSSGGVFKVKHGFKQQRKPPDEEGILNKQSWADNKGGPPAWGLGRYLTNAHHKNQLVTKYYTGLWTDSLEQNTNMMFGTKKVRVLYRSGSLNTAVSKLTMCMLDLVGVQEERERESDGTRGAVNYQMIIHFPMEMGMLIIT